MGQSLLGEVDFTAQAPPLSPPSKSCNSPHIRGVGLIQKLRVEVDKRMGPSSPRCRQGC